MPGSPLAFANAPIALNGTEKLVLFLDFDGVTHPDNWLGRPHKNIQHLMNALEGRSLDDLAILLSTTWKRHRSRRNLFKDLPEALHPWIKGATPDVEAVAGPGTRSDEIALCRMKTGYTGAWLALDDLEELFHPHDRANLLLIPGASGLTAEHTEVLKQRLDQVLGPARPASTPSSEQDALLALAMDLNVAPTHRPSRPR